MGSMGAFFGGLAQGMNQQILYKQQKRDQAQAFTEQLKQSEASQIRVSKATAKPSTQTWTDPDTGITYKGLRAQAEKELYVYGKKPTTPTAVDTWTNPETNETHTGLRAQAEKELYVYGKKPPTPTAVDTWTDPETDEKFTGIRARVEGDLYQQEQEQLLGLDPQDTDKDIMNIGQSGLEINKGGILGNEGSPGYSRELLARINAAVPVTQQGQGDAFDPARIVTTVRSLVGSITKQQLENPSDPDGSRILFERINIDDYENLKALAEQVPELKKIFESGAIPEGITAGSGNYEISQFEFEDNTGKKRQVDIFTPKDWVPYSGPIPTAGSGKVVDRIEHNNIHKVGDNSIKPFFERRRYDHTKKDWNWGLGTAMLSMYGASGIAGKASSAAYLDRKIESEFWESIPIEERTAQDHQTLMRDFTKATFHYIPNENYNEDEMGRVYVARNVNSQYKVSDQAIQLATSSSDLGFELISDLQTMDELLRKEGANTSYAFRADSFLDMVLDPESGIGAAIGLVKDRLAGVFREKAKVVTDDKDLQKWENSSVAEFMDGMVNLIEQEEGLEDAVLAKKAELAGTGGKITKKQQEVIDKTHRRLLMAKMTYQFAAMFQGGAGGRMISDQDFKIVMTALFNNPGTVAARSALGMLRAKIQLVQYRNYATQVYGSTGVHREMINRYQAYFDHKYKVAKKQLYLEQGITDEKTGDVALQNGSETIEGAAGNTFLPAQGTTGENEPPLGSPG